MLKLVTFIALVLAFACAQAATLIPGDELSVRHEKDGVIQDSWNVVVPETIGPDYMYNRQYSFAVANSGIYFSGRACCGFFGAVDFDGIIFDGFDPSRRIVNVYKSQGTWLIPASIISFTDSSLSLNFKGLSSNNFDNFILAIDTEAASPVPLPAALPLLASAIAGIWCWRSASQLLAKSDV